MEDPVISTKISTAIEDACGINMDLPDDIEEVVPTPLATVEDVRDLSKDFRSTTQNNLEQDYDFAVVNLRTMIQKGMKAVDGAVALARESESPRMFEAASTFLKCLSDLNKDLVSLSEDQCKKSPKALTEQGSTSGTVTNNSIFIGSSEELASIVHARITNTFNND